MYVPELIFGHLLTSDNYDDTEKRVTGGRNGFGAKLTNVFSTEFTVECLDAKNGRSVREGGREGGRERVRGRGRMCVCVCVCVSGGSR